MRNFTPFPVLKTNRLLLRQLLKTDDHKVLALRADAIVNKYIGRNLCPSVEEAQLFIAAINQNILRNDSLYWAITLNDQLVGTVCLFDFSDENDEAEIGFELLPACQGNGYMHEAASAVIGYGFGHCGLKAIKAFTHRDNQNAVKLLEKFNFKAASESDEPDEFVIFKLSNSNDR